MANREAPLLVLGPFKGIDKTTDPRLLDPTVGTSASNVAFNRAYGAYATHRGNSAPFASNLSVAPLQLNIGGVIAGKQYISIRNVAGTLTAAQSTNGGAWTDLTGVTLTTLRAGAFTYGNTDTTTNFYVNCRAPFRVSNDSTTTTLTWHAIAPTLAPGVGFGAGGNPNGTYNYVYTWVTDQGETSPSPVSSPITVNNQQIALTGIANSADTTVASKNIYRAGGTLGADFFLIGNVGAATTTFTDNIADTAVTGAALQLHRDPPPTAGWIDVCLHKDRAWGFSSLTVAALNSQSDLWFSSFQAPWEFDSVNGVITLEGLGKGDHGDAAMAILSIGTVLVALKRRSLWEVLGDSPQDPFLPRKVADIGCISTASAVAGDGMAFWVSESGVYQYDGNSPQYIADGIRSFLNGLSIADLQATVGWYYDHCYYISFPNQSQTWFYDLTQKAWGSISGFAPTAVDFDPNPFDTGLTNTPPQGLVIFGDATTPGQVDMFGVGETNLGAAISASFVSKIENNGSPWMTKRYRSVSVTAPIQSTTATVIVTVNPSAPSQQQTTLSVDLSKGPTQKFSLPPNMVGAEVQVEIDTSTSAFTTIDRVSVNGWEEREMISSG